MGAGIVKGNETQKKSECLFLLGVYYDEELYEELTTVTQDNVTLENFLSILQRGRDERRGDDIETRGDEKRKGGESKQDLFKMKKTINCEKYLGIVYKISLIGKDIRKILMKHQILSLLIPIIQQPPQLIPLQISSSSEEITPSLQLQQEHAIGILRNLSLDSEYHSELLQLAIQQDWFIFFHPSSEEESSLSTIGFSEHLIAFLRNLSLLSQHISTLDSSINLIKLSQKMIFFMKWNQNLQQNLAGLLWNLVSYDQEVYLHKIFDSKYLLPHLLPYLTPERDTTVFTQLNITGILFSFSVHPDFITSLFDFPQLIPALVSLLQTSLPSSDPSLSPSSSSLLAPISPPLTMIQDHITGIFLSFSFYSELRVPLYKAQITPLLMRFLAYSSTKPTPLPSSATAYSASCQQQQQILASPRDPPREDAEQLSFTPPPLPSSASSSSLSSFPPIISQLHLASSSASLLLSPLSANHCRDIILHLAQERSLRHPLCQEWRAHQLKPSLMSLLESHLAAEAEVTATAAVRK
jgi:hypothetical protein